MTRFGQIGNAETLERSESIVLEHAGKNAKMSMDVMLSTMVGQYVFSVNVQPQCQFLNGLMALTKESPENRFFQPWI